MTEKKLRIVFVSFIPILLIGLTWLKLSERIHKKWVEEIKFQDGVIVKVFHHDSEKKHYGGRHGFGIGGGDPWYKMCFSYRDIKYEWENNSIPILLNVHNGTIYLVVFDRETDWNKTCFRFYKFEENWEEVSANDFPKNISVQNMWLSENAGYYNGKPINEYQIAENLDPGDFHFCESLTAKLWLRLGKGIKYYENLYSKVEENFLREYKRKYMVKNESLSKNLKSEDKETTKKKNERAKGIEQKNVERTIIGVFWEPILIIFILIAFRILLIKLFVPKIEKAKVSAVVRKSITYITILIIICYVYLTFFEGVAIFLAIAGFNRIL